MDCRRDVLVFDLKDQLGPLPAGDALASLEGTLPTIPLRATENMIVVLLALLGSVFLSGAVSTAIAGKETES
jgi:hypothetical protein